jgi:hypothetical protein
MLDLAVTAAISFRPLQDVVAAAITPGRPAPAVTVTVIRAALAVFTRLADAVDVAGAQAVGIRCTVRIFAVRHIVAVIVEQVAAAGFQL